MSKWEYCAITGIYYDTKEGWLSAGFDKRSLMLFKEPNVFGEKIERGDPNALSTAIARLGEEGWEMVGCVPAARGDAHILYFKRAKGDDDMEWPFAAGGGQVDKPYYQR
jgi:hypothetical protein